MYNLKFADDIDLIEESCIELQKSLTTLEEDGRKAGLYINKAKTKTMVFGRENIEKELKVDGESIENVKSFNYLGSLLTYDNDCSKEITSRIAKGKGMMANFNKIWSRKEISHKTKLQIVNTCVFSVMLYASETWTMKKADQRRVLAFEMYCYRRILGTSWMDKKKNSEIRETLKIKENLMQKIIRKKLTLFGHIGRMSDERKLKSIVFGMMDGSGKKGRPHREWLDDIQDWCSKDIQQLFHLTQEREKWKRTVQDATDTYGQCAHGS